MIFELSEGFVFDQELAQGLIDNRSPIRPLPDHLLLLGRVCFVLGRGDGTGRRYARRVKQVSVSAQEIRPQAEPITSEAPFTKTISFGSRSKGDAAGSAAAQIRTDPDGEGVESDPEVRELDQALLYRPSSASIKGKGVSLITELKGLIQKRRVDAPQRQYYD
ncbi:hypothetical protein Hanom_Chr15g01404711 [Helianthus anomalus]